MFKNSVLGWLSIAAATFTLVSCQMEQEMNSDLEEVTFTASQVEKPTVTKSHYLSDGIEDETLAIEWDLGDKVGVFGSWTKNAAFTVVDAGDFWGGEEPVFSGKVTRGDKLKYAYYPYNPSSTNFRSIPFTISNVQVNATDVSTYGNDFRASNMVSQTGATYDFQFQYITSYLLLSLDLSNFEGLFGDEVVERFTLENMEGRKIAGDFSINLVSMATSEVTASNKITVELSEQPYANSGRIASVLSIVPAMKRLDRLSLTIETNYHRIYFTFPCTSNYKAGSGYCISLDPSTMNRFDHNLSVEPIDGPVGNPDGVDACMRQLDWQNGAEFEIAGRTFSNATSGLRQVYVPYEMIVNDASLMNSIVFVDPGASLFLGSAAKLGNTVIISNDPDEKAMVEGLMTAGASADPTYLALCDLNLSIPIELAGDGLHDLYVQGCDIVADNGTIFDMYGISGTSFGTLSFAGNTFHPMDLMLPEFLFAMMADDKSFENVSIKDNVFINVKDADGTMFYVGDVQNLDIENNHFFYGTKFNYDFDVVLALADPASVVSKNNTYYPGSKGTAVLRSYASPSASGYMAAAKSNTFSDYDAVEGYYEYSSNIYVGSTYMLDGVETPIAMTNKTGMLYHSPAGAGLEHYTLPGVAVSESGSWASSKTATFTYDDTEDSYTFMLPDYVAGPVQALAGDSSAWTLAWADEFNGSSWNGDAWSRIPVTNHGGIEYQDPTDASLVEMTDGAMVTWARGNNANTYAAGGVYGKDKKNFNLNMNGVQGRIDVAVKVSDAQGFWPSIWMLPADQAIDAGVVNNGEIDIFSHYHSESIVNQIINTAAGKYSCTPSYTNRDQYHVFTVVVANDAIRTYVDGALTKEVTKSAAGANGWPWDANEYYLNIAAQIGGWVGNPGANALPAHMDVDYVRYMVK